jgi:agmatinase
MLGIRSFERQERDFLETSKVTLYTAEQIFEEGIGAVVEKVLQKYEGYDAVYLSLDIDSVDPAFAPGTGTPEAFGLSSKDLLKILTGLIKNLPVRVMDIVEVSPPLDTNNITTWLALKYILEILYLIK